MLESRFNQEDGKAVVDRTWAGWTERGGGGGRGMLFEMQEQLTGGCGLCVKLTRDEHVGVDQLRPCLQLVVEKDRMTRMASSGQKTLPPISLVH